MKEPQTTIIIGAGLAGLACATRLIAVGHKVTIFEASDGPGGRVRTDEIDGFLLDRGFQVYLSAYPEAGKLLDIEQLRLQKFRAGALVRRAGKFHRVMDVFRHPESAITSALAPIGSLRDKLLVAKMRLQAKRSPIHQIENREDISTQQRLEKFGFSAKMIDSFFRAFYGGIFLERELRTSSQMFDFTFKMFAEGHATVPSRGMQGIPNQLVRRLPKKTIRYNTPVKQVTKTSVTLADGTTLQADHIVIATDATTAKKLLPEANLPKATWRATTTLYFSTPESPLKENVIALDGDGTSLINNVCVISDVAPHYAPPGRALISVSVLAETASEEAVLIDLGAWFGNQATNWKHLKSYQIKQALPEQLPNSTKPKTKSTNIHLCGDHCTTASIEGAITSGQATAKAITN